MKNNIIQRKYNLFIKTLFSVFVLFFFVWNYSFLFALSNEQKWKALENFTKKQYDLLFDSDLWSINEQYGDIFTISRKIDIFSGMAKDAKDDTKKASSDVEKVVKRITSLESSIKLIDSEISSTMKKVVEANREIVNVRKKMQANSKQVEILNRKVDKNKEILLEYIIYLYKKGNSSFDGTEVDNLKSILLNNEDIGWLLNDLYYNSLIQVAWKKLIDKHKALITDLYRKKVELNKQKIHFSLLRKQQLIATKNLNDKKKFRENLLSISKWKEKEYNKYLKEKLEIEKKLVASSVREKIKFANVKKQILSKYNCKFVDVSKNTAESREMKQNSPKCYKINNMIYAESKLSDTSKIQLKTEKNIFDWPVNPYRWITAFFKDKWYEETFWAEHNAIDIRVPQSTPIKAPIDWYVIYINKPVSQDYSFVAIKHFDWYISVYWHLSEVMVDEYEYVEKWQIFAKTWWEYGTRWAWYITTWPHLHFEIFKDKKYIDPLTVLDLSYLNYRNLPDETSKIKYLFDFKKRKWYNYSDVNKNTKTFVLKWKDEIERQKYLLNTYAVWWFRNWQLWVDEALAWKIDPSLPMCIWLAESGLGRNLTTAYNIGNVWNNDRWDRIWLSGPRAWIYAIIRTLNNRYFGNVNRLDMLSWAGRLRSWLPSCREIWEYCYASDRSHWHPNVIRCLSHLKWRIVEDDYNFRLQ